MEMVDTFYRMVVHFLLLIISTMETVTTTMDHPFIQFLHVVTDIQVLYFVQMVQLDQFLKIIDSIINNNN
jgi:hypothetical protein